MSDEVFLHSLFELETVAQVQDALKEKGVELTEADILVVLDLLRKAEQDALKREQLMEDEEGVLPEELLAHVAGGTTTGEHIMVAVGILSHMPAGLLALSIMEAEEKW
jgi:hypothetical protein